MDFMSKETKNEKHLHVFTSEGDKEIDDHIDDLLDSYRQDILRVFEPSDSLRKLLPQALAKLEEAEN
jgi:hypothetical protein